jgi:hypothetical protein
MNFFTENLDQSRVLPTLEVLALFNVADLLKVDVIVACASSSSIGVSSN